eukprot:266003-Alexandrium_andersonii.AAC.1
MSASLVGSEMCIRDSLAVAPVYSFIGFPFVIRALGLSSVSCPASLHALLLFIQSSGTKASRFR